MPHRKALEGGQHDRRTEQDSNVGGWCAMTGPRSNSRIGRWGIGPVFGTITVTYVLTAWYLTYRWPDLFRISMVPREWLVGAGILPMSWGIWLYVRALHALNEALRNGRLAVNGPFARARHPIYATWLLLLIPGIGLVLQSWLVLSAVAVGYVGFRVLVHREEAEVEARHGDDYRKYCCSHNRLLPTFWRPRSMTPGDPPSG